VFENSKSNKEDLNKKDNLVSISAFKELEMKMNEKLNSILEQLKEKDTIIVTLKDTVTSLEKEVSTLKYN
jgi:uncharacterized membrane protein YgaE (UPF0421/DUF939 family)